MIFLQDKNLHPVGQLRHGWITTRVVLTDKFFKKKGITSSRACGLVDNSNRRIE